MAEKQGVLARHRDRMENDAAYRESALTAPAPVRGKFLTNTAPTVGKADRDAEADVTVAGQAQRERSIDGPVADGARDTDGSDKYDALTGDELEDAVRSADIDGRSSMNADEKRAALRKIGW